MTLPNALFDAADLFVAAINGVWCWWSVLVTLNNSGGYDRGFVNKTGRFRDYFRKVNLKTSGFISSQQKRTPSLEGNDELRYLLDFNDIPDVVMDIWLPDIAAKGGYNLALCYGGWYIPAVPRTDKGTHSTGTGSSVLVMTRLVSFGVPVRWDSGTGQQYIGIQGYAEATKYQTLIFGLASVKLDLIFRTQTLAKLAPCSCGKVVEEGGKMEYLNGGCEVHGHELSYFDVNETDQMGCKSCKTFLHIRVSGIPISFLICEATYGVLSDNQPEIRIEAAGKSLKSDS
ncbi:hypothetical protein Tco_1094740 [Tanacetum coccineum]|uniref:Uncharacterized protein n=1 Tax=Tanacetum coccineum TaxID=301880 RepID=A0ABQ5IID1_9ASTR